jgi:hypothetical protein
MAERNGGRLFLGPGVPARFAPVGAGCARTLQAWAG